VLDQARTGLERLYTALYKVQEIAPQAPGEARSGRFSFVDKFDAVLEDDFNTPSAIAVLFDIVKGINRAIESGESATALRLASELQHLASRLGLLYQNPGVMLGAGGASVDASGHTDEAQSAVIEGLIRERSQAREEKDFQTSDKVRAQLEKMGVILEDRPDGSTFWRQR
jgi:cysteinyl-tRNA synthetase